jgi:hypothetical protein
VHTSLQQVKAQQSSSLYRKLRCPLCSSPRMRVDSPCAVATRFMFVCFVREQEVRALSCSKHSSKQASKQLKHMKRFNIQCGCLVGNSIVAMTACAALMAGCVLRSNLVMRLARGMSALLGASRQLSKRQLHPCELLPGSFPLQAFVFFCTPSAHLFNACIARLTRSTSSCSAQASSVHGTMQTVHARLRRSHSPMQRE